MNLEGKHNPVYVAVVVVQSPSHVRLCDPMDCSMPGFSVPHHLPEFAQVHVHRIGDAIQLFYPLSNSSSASNLSQHQGLFQWLALETTQVASSCSATSCCLNILCQSIFHPNQ